VDLVLVLLDIKIKGIIPSDAPGGTILRTTAVCHARRRADERDSAEIPEKWSGPISPRRTIGLCMT
jgi:hypothetical protein